MSNRKTETGSQFFNPHEVHASEEATTFLKNSTIIFDITY